MESNRHKLADGTWLDMGCPISIRHYVASQLAKNTSPTSAELKRLEMLDAAATKLEAGKPAQVPGGQAPLASVTSIADAEETLRQRLRDERYARRNGKDDAG